ncbi:MAG: UDP-glucose 4-epimerase GalE [Planctomycetota bacterium]
MATAVESSVIMVTGGAGYIGSHAVMRLLENGAARVVVVDSLERGHRAAIERLETVAGGRLSFLHADTRDADAITDAIVEHGVRTVMHFAALTYVGESVIQPLRYYSANTTGSVSVLRAIDAAHARGAMVDRLVFSSTCATYGDPPADRIPITEDTPQAPVNPYGASKLFFERVLADYVAACETEGRAFSYACLRYFNVAGGDPAGLIGEHHVPETHLIPLCIQAALGLRDKLTVFGDDYDTPDGTCLRDYVHVSDLIEAHLLALDALADGKLGSALHYNIGLGKPVSVMDIIRSVERVTRRSVPHEIGARRSGDPPALYADASKIERELGFKARYTDLDEIVATAWSWFRRNPSGYA